MTLNDYFVKLENKRVKIKNSEYLDYLNDHKLEADINSKICVQIADYHDIEMIRTMQSCIETAANPDRIHFAVCYQGDDFEEIKKIKEFKNCKLVHFMRDDAPGTCGARYACSLLLDNEEYSLHIDSHMVFTAFWDVCMIQQWKDCNDEKAIVSAYPPNYAQFYDDDIDYDKHILMKANGLVNVASKFTEKKTVHFRAKPGYVFIGKNSYKNVKPKLGAYVSAAFLFFKSEVDKLVPIDPRTFFIGDEIAMNVRYYTHGYNIYHPIFRCVYHLYTRVETIQEKKNIKIERLNVKKQKNETPVLEQLFRYADHGINLVGFDIGNARTIKEYERFAGIDFKKRRIRKFATTGNFGVEHTIDELRAYKYWEQ